jgi:hypothetical protein
MKLSFKCNTFFLNLEIPWTIKSADETVGAELSWEVWLSTSLLSIAVLGDLLMTASSLVLETKLPIENSCYLEHPRTLSTHLKEIGLRGYVTLSQVYQQIWIELKRTPQIDCHTPEQLSDILNLPRLLVNLEDLISRIVIVHDAQSKIAADLFVSAETASDQEDFGRHSVLQLLSTASVIFIQFTKLWHNLQDFFFMCFGEDNIPQLEERNVTEPLERILYCTNLLGDLVTANPEDVHKTWHDLINSCKKTVDVVEQLQYSPLR